MIDCKGSQSKKKQVDNKVFFEKGLVELSEIENYLFIQITDKGTKKVTIYTHKYQE